MFVSFEMYASEYQEKQKKYSLGRCYNLEDLEEPV